MTVVATSPSYAQRLIAALPAGHRVSLFSLDAGRPLLERVCAHLGAQPGRQEERVFEDAEHKLRPLESVRGRDVYVVESLVGDDTNTVNDKLVRVLFFISTLRDAGAQRVSVVAPYLCYARKDMRTKPRDPVTTRYVATLFEAAGLDRMVVMDVHNRAAYENAFRIPAEHLTAAPLFVDALAPLLGDQPVAVVSPDAGGAKRAEKLRQALEHRLERSVGSAYVEKYRSEGVVSGGGAVVGDVRGRAVIICDDLISSGTTLARGAAACRAQGATSVSAVATHGVFSANAAQVLGDSAIDHLFIVDTIPTPSGMRDALQERLHVLDGAPLLAAAIHRLHTDRSLTELDPAASASGS